MYREDIDEIKTYLIECTGRIFSWGAVMHIANSARKAKQTENAQFLELEDQELFIWVDYIQEGSLLKFCAYRLEITQYKDNIKGYTPHTFPASEPNKS